MSDKVTISDETLGVFKALYEVDQSLTIDHQMTNDDGDRTILRSKSFNNTTMVRAEIPEIFPRNVNIYDLREFISVINIVNDPTFDFSQAKQVQIESADQTQRIRYLEANPDLINSFSAKDPDLPNKDVELLVTEDQLKSVLVAASTLRFEYIGFVADGEKLVLTAFNKNDGNNQETNQYSLELGESDQTFKMLYKLQLQNINILSGEGELAFTLDCHRRISRVDTMNGKTFWISFDISSEYESGDE